MRFLHLLSTAAVLLGMGFWPRVELPTAAAAAAAAAASSEPGLREARQLFLTGRYAEAVDGYRALEKRHPMAAACGVADVFCATGRDDRARDVLEAVDEQYANDPRPSAALAVLHFRRGRYDAAQQAVQKALAIDPNQLAARWVQAELFRTAGELDDANRAYRWFIDYDTTTDSDLSSEALYWIGQAASEYARWNRLHDQFDWLVHTIYPDAVAAEPDFWPARVAVGRLFMEKFNTDAATRELVAARKINPNSALILTALAELAIRDFDLAKARHLLQRALAIDPKCIDALLLEADIAFVTCELEAALAVLERARAVHPRHEPTLGRLAAAYGLVDGTLGQPDRETPPWAGLGTDRGAGSGGQEPSPAVRPVRLPDSRLAALVAEVQHHNRCPGTFYYEMGLALDKCRQFPAAADSLTQAIAVMPQLVGPHAHLGLMRMCLGEEADARKQLDASFAIDPFNVRVKNSLEVLDVLAGYEDLTTEHFIIRFDPRHDRVLAKCAARHLERIYPELAWQLHYEPVGRTLIELFNRAKNTDGHGWFSARVVGLPRIDTMAACTGKIIAMAAPTARSDIRVPWARILQHELVHVFNFQQTHYNIPHWYTEALAVHFEGRPRSPEWNALLVDRVPRGELFDLQSIHLGFIRPRSNADWQMAYCQAELYAEYMLDRFGDEALVRLLAAYAKTMQTARAIPDCFGIPMTEFERGYQEYIENVTEDLAIGTRPSRSLTELKKAHDAAPEDPECAAGLAVAYLDRQDMAAARALIDPMLGTHPKHPRVLYADAKRFLAGGDPAAAIERLVTGLDAMDPDPEILQMLAGLRYQAGAVAESQRLLELGAARWPDDLTWTRQLAAIALHTGATETLYNLLEQLAAVDGDSANLRKKLARLAAERGDPAAAARWAEEAIHIDVLDASMHELAARALVQVGRDAEAARTFEICVDLEPNRRDLRLEWAKAWHRAGESDRACKVLQPLADQGDQEAQRLCKEMED